MLPSCLRVLGTVEKSCVLHLHRAPVPNVQPECGWMYTSLQLSSALLRDFFAKSYSLSDVQHVTADLRASSISELNALKKTVCVVRTLIESNLLSLLSYRLPGQCQYLGLPVADYFKQWINLKKVLFCKLPWSPSPSLPLPCPSPFLFKEVSNNYCCFALK